MTPFLFLGSISAAKPEPPPAPKSAKEAAAVAIPAGSGDYSKMLAEVLRFKKGETTFEQLKKFVVSANLPPHPLGCGYLVMPVPPPPPGVPYNPAMMPHDWEHTFGEVTMTFWAGKLSREEYDRLHEAAHKGQPGFPNCGPPKK